MIDLELPENLVQLKGMINNVASGMYRPISRKYDIAEHEKPVELDALGGMVSGGMSSMGGGGGKKKGDKGKDSGEKKEKKKGGAGANMFGIISVEEMCWGDTALMLTTPGIGLGNAAIAAVATEEQLERFGGKWAAMAITEPASGSDSGSIRTTAKLDGDEWVLNGEKIFVTAAERCDVVVVWATLDRSKGKAAIRSFVVEKGRPGFKLEKLENKMGLRASDTGVFVLQDCRIPKTNILGSAEIETTTKGFKGAMKTFDNTRPMVAGMALGTGRAALEVLEKTLKENGMPLDHHKGPNSIRSVEKDYYSMEAQLEASRLLTWRAAWMADNEESNSTEASMCKAKAARQATLITQKCVELLGFQGYNTKELVEKWMRDTKVLDIYEGTGQIQHLIIARSILGLSSKELK